MLVVVDTNILVSGLLKREGPPAHVLDAISVGQLRPGICVEMMAEFEEVLRRPRLKIDPLRARELLLTLHATATWVEVPTYTGTPALPDPSDWPFVACALALGCSVITGNVKHFPEEVGVRVMTAREWVGSAG